MSLVAWYPLNGNLKDISGNHYDLNTNYLYGDVNQDGKIDSTDSRLVLDYFTGNATLTDNQRALADVNQDGNINSRDSKEILNYVNGTSTEGLVGKPSNIQRFEPVWGEGKTGRYALEFTDNKDMLYIENFLKSKEISISFWFYPLRKQDVTQWIVRIGDSTMNNLPLGIYINNSLKIESFGKASTCDIELNKWTHIIITTNGRLTSTYINGKLVDTFNYDYSFDYTGDLTIGGRFSSNITKEQIYLLKGRMNNLKIYDHCLSKEEAYQDYLSPMLHYTFEQPFAEETENVKHNHYFLGVTNGSDIKGDYLIKKSTDNWNMGLCLNNPVVYGGNYYTWSLEINPDTDLIINNSNELFDTNLITPTYTDVDSGRSIIDYYKGGVPKNTWTRVWVTCYIKQESGMGTLTHVFCPKVPDGSSQIKVYYRNSMLEKKDHVTPYTRDRREGQLIRDVSGQGNDGKVVYKRERITINDSIYSNGCRVTKSGQNTFTIDNFSYNTDTNTRVNVVANLYRIPKNNKYHYINSTVSYEFDIKLENIVIESGKTFLSLFQGITHKSDGNKWIGGGPVHATNITQRLRNGTNSTYHITIEKQINNSESVVSTVTGYDIQLRFDYIQSGKIIVSNFYAYYRDLDTSTLGITNRNNVIGTHSISFKNGKERIEIPQFYNEANELSYSTWVYRDENDSGDYYRNLFTQHSSSSSGSLWLSYDTESSGLWNYNYGNDNNYHYFKVRKLGVVEKGKWTHIVYTFKNGLNSFYINGELIGTQDDSSIYTKLKFKDTINYIGERETVGNSAWRDGLFADIDDVRIYPIALTEEEVKALYQTKAKIDKDSNMYTNQLVETKRENLAKLSKHDSSFNPKTISYDYYTDGIYISALTSGSEKYTLEHRDGIYKVTITNTTTPRGLNTGIYFRLIEGNRTLMTTPIPGKRYKASMWFRVSKSGKWAASAECLNSSQEAKYIEGNKWIRYENSALAKSASTAFIFYYQDGPLQPNDTIEVRDFDFYRIDDDLLPIEADTDPKITKKAQIKGFELNEIDYDRLTKRQNIIEKDGAKWVEVFYHNTNNNTEWFADEAEALHCTSQYKYSRLDCLEQYRQSDGKFEFLLEYPEIPDQFNRWKQTDNPIHIIEDNSHTEVNGFESIKNTAPGTFKGITKSSSEGSHLNTYCLINGNTNNTAAWWFAIGAYRGYTDGDTTITPGIPGLLYTDDTGSHAKIVNEVKLYARISDEQINLGPTIINKYGAQWLEVFYHNAVDGTNLFNNKEEAMHIIGDKNKYSILDCLEQYRGKDNKFEFLLEYPTDIPGKYNRWKQTDNPAEIKEDSSLGQYYAKGYEPIHIDWTNQSWGGLLLCTGFTLINGSIGHPNWHYAIGSLVTWKINIDNKPAIPGPNYNNPIYHDIHLYVRIDNINNRQQIAKLLKTGIIKTKKIKEV